MTFLPDLATKTPLWLALLTVGVNALVGALRASIDDEHHWDIVGMATFAVLMGLGGGFIRDGLVGNLPVESLRTPWYLLTVLGAIVAALLFGEVSNTRAAAVAGVAAAIVAHFGADRLGLTSRRAVGVSALLLTREKKR